MQGAVRQPSALHWAVFLAALAAPPATALAKPKPVEYVLVSHTDASLITLSTKTGKLTFKAENGHFGQFTVAVKHGTKKTVYHFMVKKPKPGHELPTRPVAALPTRSTSQPVTIVIITIVPITISGYGTPGTPTPTPVQPPAPEPSPPTAPHNFAPALHPDEGTTSWSADKGADTLHGAISSRARETPDLTTTATNLGLATSWAPAPPVPQLSAPNATEPADDCACARIGG
jgi:hypothetical protein